MYVLATHLKNLPIIALRNGAIVAHAGELLIDYTKLELVAVYAQFPGWRGKQAVIMARDIREIAREGMVVDSLEDIEDISEIVRLNDIVEQKFNIIGIKVVNESGNNLGHVDDVSIEAADNTIQKLYVKPSLLRNLLINNLVIDRSQVVNVTPKEITVRDATVPKAKLAATPAK
jgi:sporulation protein YlmC with PRC-barrel domain